MNFKEVLQSNKESYEDKYSRNEGFLRYPADWLIRFHNMFLKPNLPLGKVLDYGCGSGNNSVFFMQKGYEVYGVEVAKASLGLIRENIKYYHLPEDKLKNFSIISPDTRKLEFEDGFFDFIFSNQVLYYLPQEEHIKSLAKEFSRILKPGGIVFFTMMGPKNYYISHHTKNVYGNVYDVKIDVPGHRLDGTRELVYLVRDEEELRKLFEEFQCLSVGYFDQSMFDMKSNFHWIFVGKKQ